MGTGHRRVHLVYRFRIRQMNDTGRELALDHVRQAMPQLATIAYCTLKSDAAHTPARPSVVPDFVPVNDPLGMNKNGPGPKAALPRSPLLHRVEQHEVVAVTNVKAFDVVRIVTHVHFVVQPLELYGAEAYPSGVVEVILERPCDPLRIRDDILPN